MHISCENVVLAFVGSIVPDNSRFDTPAFSRAGNMFQENLLVSMRDAGLSASLILSQQPLPSFPKSHTLWIPYEQILTGSGLNIELLPFPNFPFLRPIIVGIVVLKKLIVWGWKHRRYHKIVYAFNLTEPPGLFTLIAAKITRSRFIASVNDINIPGETVPDSLARRIDFWLQKKIIPRLDGLITVSKHIINHFAPQSPFIRIEGGMREEKLRRYFSQPINVKNASDPFVIVAAGGLDKTNGTLEILDAFSILLGDRYRLRIAGIGPLTESVKRAAKSDPRIEYVGYISYEDVLQLYTTADVLINMRLTKQMKTDYFFPSKMIEYLASSIPVITTCTGHVEEEFAEIAFLLKDESPQSLASMIEQVADMDPAARARVGRLAREHIWRHYTWESHGRRLVAFIRQKIMMRQGF